MFTAEHSSCRCSPASDPSQVSTSTPSRHRLRPRGRQERLPRGQRTRLASPGVRAGSAGVLPITRYGHPDGEDGIDPRAHPRQSCRRPQSAYPAAPSYARSTETEPRQAGGSLGSRGLHRRCQPLGRASRCLARGRGVQREGGVQPSSGWRRSQALLIGSVPRRALRARAAPRRRWRLRPSSCPGRELRSGPAFPRRRGRTLCRASRLSLRRSARRRSAAALAWRAPAYAGS